MKLQSVDGSLDDVNDGVASVGRLCSVSATTVEVCWREGEGEGENEPARRRRLVFLPPVDSTRLLVLVIVLVLVPSHSLKSPCIHSLSHTPPRARQISHLLLPPSLASFRRLFISPTPISLPGKYLQELATIDDYLVNSPAPGGKFTRFSASGCPGESVEGGEEGGGRAFRGLS